MVSHKYNVNYLTKIFYGNIVEVEDVAGNTLNVLSILDRGYTGRQHLQSAGIVHVNGRLYDLMLYHFLQFDNYAQDPSNFQYYNHYGQCVNN